MAPVRMLNLRGGSVSPSNRVYDTSVIKVDGEVFDRDGYRMDVTVWFRHRNEVLYYLDSGGSVHGPMDQKHSTRLGNISRSGQLIPGSRYYLSDSSTRHRTMRRQSDSAAWDIRSEGASRGRTYSESYRPLSNERSHEVTSSRYYNQYTPSTTHYKTTASHHVGAASPPTAHISRWSSMQSYGTHGLWRGSSGNRYATTLTRQHIKKHRDPVEVLVKHAPSVGASKVDLVSIDNRAAVSPQQVVYSPNTYTYSQVETETNTERERRLQDELLSTKRELQALKRSRSLSGEQGGLLPSSTRQKSTSTQYLNQSSWTTHTLMKNDGLPCGARFADYEKPLQIDDSEGNQLKLPSLSSSISVRNVGNPLCSEFATAEPSDATDSTTTLRDGGLLRETLNPQGTHNPNHVKIMKHINSVDTNNEHVKTATSSLIPTKPLRSVRSNPSSPILGKPHEHCSVYKGSVSPHRTPSANKSQGNVSGLPPAPRRASPNRSTRRDPATGAVLSPTGPPVEQVSTLIEPATGQQKQVTTRSQSFTDLNRNVILTELDETIEDDETMEHCIKKRLVRKGHNNSVRERKSTDRTDNSPRQLSTKHEHALPTVPDRMGLTAEKQLREKIDEIEELITELKTRSNQLVKATDSTIKPYPMSSWAVSQATPGRATSQTNIPGYTSLGRPQWTSDLNIRSTTNYKQMPMHSTYSAHRENMQRREEQRRATEAEQRSTRYFDDSKVAGGAEVLEEVETITLQPIGRGVHDLEATGSVGRSYRAYTPTGSVQSIRSVPIRWSKIQPENLTRFHSQQQETGHRGWAHQMSAQSPKLVHESASADFFNFIGTPVIHSGPFPYSNSAEFQGPLRVDTTSYRPRHQGRQNLSPLGITRSLPRTTGSASPRNCEQRSPKGMVVRRPMFSTLNAHESSSPASRAYTPGPDQSDGYRTIATTNVHREIPTSGGPSPFAGIRQNSLYEGRGSENRYRTSQPLDSHWRATTVPPNYAGSVSGMSASGDASEWEQVLLKQVKNTFREWYMPEKSREDVENLLRDREPGSFIVRNRLSHENSFSLGLKAPGLPDPYRHGSIKHYIINSVPMHDGRGTGLQLSGFSDQPVFPDFVSFVHHHCMHAGPFPCALRLPISFASSQPPSNAYGSINKVKMPAGGGGVVVDMLYLGSVQVDKLETLSAVRKAVTKILGQASTNGKGLSKRSVVTVSAKPNEGVRFSGSTKRGKMDESIKPSDISFCGLDPEGRTFSGEELRARGLTQARMFGIVARSKPIWMHGNLVFVFSELDPNQSALSLISYINQVFVS